MAEYLELPLTADATALSDIGKDYLAEEISEWNPRPGNVETILIESTGQIGAEVVDQAAQVPPVIFAYFGSWLLGIGLQEATPAVGTVAIAFAAGVATAVPEGSLLAAPNPDGESYVFQTDNEVRSDAATKTTTVTALEVGAAANGCLGVCELIDVIDGVASVTMTLAAGAGADEEDADAYLDRLADALTILAPRPILPQDHATMARQIEGVGRALAIDLYKPGTNDNIAAGQPGGPLTVEGVPLNAGAGTTNVPRCVSVAITAENGQPPSQALMHSVWLTLDGAREVNFLEYVVPPTYTTIEVQATVVAYPGYVLAEVQAAAVEMMQVWLDPSGWGAEEIGEEQGWSRQTSARLYEAVDYLNRADGVQYVSTVQLRKAGGAFAASDVALTGIAPLPFAGAITITVQAPAP
jgi:hypothetical protein